MFVGMFLREGGSFNLISYVLTNYDRKTIDTSFHSLASVHKLQ